jgi:hypothetical protein
MQALLTKEDVRQFFGLNTIEATEKLLQRLGVPKMNFAIIGGKGVRYRRPDIEEALAKIEVKSRTVSRQRKQKQAQTDLFDLPVK